MQQNKPTARLDKFGKPERPSRSKFISNHEDLEVYQIAFDAAMEIFELSKN